MEIITHQEAMEHDVVSTRPRELHPVIIMLRTMNVGEVLKFRKEEWGLKNTPGSVIGRYFRTGAGKDLGFLFTAYLTKDGFYLVERKK